MEQKNGTNGSLSDRLDALIDEVMASAPDEEADVSSPETAPSDTVPPGTTSAPDLSALLGGLAANPDLMAKLPQMLGMLGPLLGSLGTGRSDAGNVHGGKKYPHGDRHTALLCAVKPYLCAERQTAADQLIQLCKMWDLLGGAPASRGGDDHV